MSLGFSPTHGQLRLHARKKVPACLLCPAIPELVLKITKPSMSSSRADKALKTEKAADKVSEERPTQCIGNDSGLFYRGRDKEGDSEDDCEMESTGNTTTENK